MPAFTTLGVIAGCIEAQPRPLTYRQEGGVVRTHVVFAATTSRAGAWRRPCCAEPRVRRRQPTVGHRRTSARKQEEGVAAAVAAEPEAAESPRRSSTCRSGPGPAGRTSPSPCVSEPRKHHVALQRARNAHKHRARSSVAADPRDGDTEPGACADVPTRDVSQTQTCPEGFRSGGHRTMWLFPTFSKPSHRSLSSDEQSFLADHHCALIDAM